MQLQIEINDTKSSMFLKILETFKVGNIINTYSIIQNEKENDTAEILSDISMLNTTLKNAQNGKGRHTGKYITIEDA